MSNQDDSGMDIQTTINKNSEDTIKWLAQFFSPAQFNEEINQKFKNDYLTSIDKISCTPKDVLVKNLVKIDIVHLTSLRVHLSEFFLSKFVLKNNEKLSLKDKKLINSIASDIFNITVYIVEESRTLISSIKDTYNIKRDKITSEEIGDKIDQILDHLTDIDFDYNNNTKELIQVIIDDNTTLKKANEQLNNKVDLLTTHITKILEILSSNKHLATNNSQFSFLSAPTNATPITNTAVSTITAMPTRTGVLTKGPLLSTIVSSNATPSSTKRKINDSNTNSNNNKHLKMTTTNNNNSRQKELKNFDSKNPSNPSYKINDDKWKKTKYDRKKEKTVTKKSSIPFSKQVGTGSFNNLEAVDRPHCIQIKRVANSVSEENITNFLKGVLNLKINDFKAQELQHTHFKAYTFTINYLKRKIIYDKKQWPDGWVVNSFYPPKQPVATTNTMQQNTFIFGNTNTNTASTSSNKTN